MFVFRCVDQPDVHTGLQLLPWRRFAASSRVSISLTCLVSPFPMLSCSYVRLSLEIQSNFDKYVAATYLDGDATDPTALEGATIKAQSLNPLSIEAMQVCGGSCRDMCRQL